MFLENILIMFVTLSQPRDYRLNLDNQSLGQTRSNCPTEIGSFL